MHYNPTTQSGEHYKFPQMGLVSARPPNEFSCITER